MWYNVITVKELIKVKWLVMIDSQDCETQNTILGVYSSKIRALLAIANNYIEITESDFDYDEVEVANYLIEELEKANNGTSILYHIYPIEENTDVNIEQ